MVDYERLNAAYAAGDPERAMFSLSGRGVVMTVAQRWWLVGVLCATAVGLVTHFVDYRWADKELERPRLVLAFRERYLTPTEPPPNWLEPCNLAWDGPPRDGNRIPFHCTTVEGLYLSRDYTPRQAKLGGVLMPLVLLGAAVYLSLGSSRSSTRPN